MLETSTTEARYPNRLWRWWRPHTSPQTNPSQTGLPLISCVRWLHHGPIHAISHCKMCYLQLSGALLECFRTTTWEILLQLPGAMSARGPVIAVQHVVDTRLIWDRRPTPTLESYTVMHIPYLSLYKDYLVYSRYPYCRAEGIVWGLHPFTCPADVNSTQMNWPGEHSYTIPSPLL